ncbi:MAG: TolC family protein [Bacteroidota bacterium]
MNFKAVFLFLFFGTTSFFAQEKKTYKIGVLIDYQTDEVLNSLDDLKSEIFAVVGEDANLQFPSQSILSHNSSLEKAKVNYQKLIDNDTDIILAFGPINSKILEEIDTFQKPTILFGAINKDVSQVNNNIQKSGIENFTFLVSSASYNEDLKIFKELSGFKNLGILVDKGMESILPLNETFDRQLQRLDASYKIIPFQGINDIVPNLEGIDAVYMIGGFFLTDKDVKNLADLFIKNNIPSFTVNGVNSVKNGLLASNQSEENLNNFFRRIAMTVALYIEGNPLSELPVFIDSSSRLTINYNTAQLVGVPIKYSLIGKTDFVGDFNNVLSEKNYNLLTVVNEAISKNLSLQSDKKDVDLSQQDVKTAKSDYLPALEASASGIYTDPDLAAVSLGNSPEFSTTGNVSLDQTLFSEQINAGINIQKNVLKAEQENYNSALLDVIFDAANAYFTTLILKASLQIEVQNVDLTKANLEIAELNFAAGQEGKTDVLRFRSELAQNTQAMVEAINLLSQGFIELNQVLNNPINLEIDVADVVLNQGILKQYNYEELFSLLDDPVLREPFTEFLIKEAMQNAPELKSLGYTLKAVERDIKLNRYGRLLPTVGLQAQYDRTFSRSGEGSSAPEGFGLVDGSYNAGLSIGIPLINRNRSNINLQTARIQKDQLMINESEIAQIIEVNVRKGVLNMVNQISNIKLSEISEEAAKETLLLTQTSYSNGAVNIVQLLDAQNNFFDAQLARANAIYNYMISSLQLERFIGYYFLLKTQAENSAFQKRFFEFLDNQN